MESVFWLALALVAFSYAGYPLVLAAWEGARDVLSGLRFVAGGPDRRVRGAGEAWPRVTLLFSAFDEADVIQAKIENCLALDYPQELLEIAVGCDGCTDRTAALARAAGRGRVTVHELTPRSGKSSVLDRLVPQARGDVVVLTDANVMLDAGAIRALARGFRDPSVGAVVGRLRLYNPTRQDFQESLYWKYETALKWLEGRRGCVLGANGGLYAIRRLLFAPLPPDTITDDFVIPARIAARGWRVPFEPDAVAWEETTEDTGREFGRRARIGAGNWQALTRVPDLVDPRTGFLCFAFVSHKLLRWATPFLLAAAALANGVLAGQPGAWGYRTLLLLQLAFYGLAVAGWRNAALGGRLRRIAGLAHYFVAMNAALAVGLWRFLRGTQRAAWQRTARTAAGPGAGAA
jgi:cellulose synthase/poly-beta-1,6-N-acetylglucosamine synthase-like glycosyltransferase